MNQSPLYDIVRSFGMEFQSGPSRGSVSVFEKDGVWVELEGDNWILSAPNDEDFYNEGDSEEDLKDGLELLLGE